MTDESAHTHHELPEWVPEEYDPEAPLEERLPVIAEMEGGIEIHVKDGRTNVIEIVHQPQHFHDYRHRMKLDCGYRLDDWQWEIVVPKNDADPVLKSVDPNQGAEAYEATKKTALKQIDVRVFGVDLDRWMTEAEA